MSSSTYGTGTYGGAGLGETGASETTATSTGSQAQEMLRSATQAGLDALDRKLHLRERVDENPWKVLGIAVAAGYIAGGGLFSSLTPKLLGLGIRIGLRMAVLPVVRQELSGLVGAVKQGASGTYSEQH